MFFRLIVKGEGFNYEEHFACKTHPTIRQLINYYSSPVRVFEDGVMASQVLQLLKSPELDMPRKKSDVIVGKSVDCTGAKYKVIIERLDFQPLGECDG